MGDFPLFWVGFGATRPFRQKGVAFRAKSLLVIGSLLEGLSIGFVCSPFASPALNANGLKMFWFKIFL
jgi:hypothetical protein